MSGEEKRWCSLREITQNVRGLDSKNKSDIIETLMDRGLIKTKAGSKKKGSREDYRGWRFKPAD
jgi:predicted transcriptional regulator